MNIKPLVLPVRTGSGTRNPNTTPKEFIESRIERLPECGCWIWTGTLKANGYGLYRLGKKKECFFAHRLSYEVFIGPIPSGLVIDHLCRVRSCVNPNHLEAVTFKTNVERGLSKNGSHCRNNHPYDTYVRFVGSKKIRRCKACDKIAAASYRARKKKKEENIT